MVFKIIFIATIVLIDLIFLFLLENERAIGILNDLASKSDTLRWLTVAYTVTQMYIMSNSTEETANKCIKDWLKSNGDDTKVASTICEILDKTSNSDRQTKTLLESYQDGINQGFETLYHELQKTEKQLRKLKLTSTKREREILSKLMDETKSYIEENE